MAASTLRINLQWNCSSNNSSVTSKRYWIGSRHKTGFCQPHNRPQVQSIVQGSLNGAIERAASAAAQAAVRAFSGSPLQAPDQATPTVESSVDVTPHPSAALTSNSLLESQISSPSLGNCSRSATDTVGGFRARTAGETGQGDPHR